jgi:hypothetical protein
MGVLVVRALVRIRKETRSIRKTEKAPRMTDAPRIENEPDVPCMSPGRESGKSGE